MIDPEYWSDEKIGSLTRDARLLFIGLWNFADDEGLVRWNESFIRASIFPYDNLSAKKIKSLQNELTEKELVFEYRGGLTAQTYAFIINFLKYQRIDKPQKSKLPAPSIQNPQIKKIYLKRDDYTCHLCKEKVDLLDKHDHPKSKAPSLDHVIPKIKGGTDYPSNIRIAHISCNKSRGSGDLIQESFQESFQESLLPNISKDNISKENIREDKRSRANTLQEVVDFCNELSLPTSDAEHLWNKWEGNGWKNHGDSIKDWKATIRSWKAAGYLPSQKDKHGTGKNTGGNRPTETVRRSGGSDFSNVTKSTLT